MAFDTTSAPCARSRTYGVAVSVDLSYIHEKYLQATVELARGTEPVRERLLSVYSRFLVEAYPAAPGVGEVLSRDIDDLRGRLTQRPDPDGSGTLQSSVFLMDDDDVSAAVADVCNI